MSAANVAEAKASTSKSSNLTQPDPELKGSLSSDSNDRWHVATEAEQEAKIAALAEQYGVNHSKLMWKVDLVVVPPICLLYLLAFLDRVNISNAYVYGMATDLKLQGHQYNTALTIFFVPYVLSDIPANWFLKRLKPHVWLSLCMLIFGAALLAQGFVKNFGGLMTTRWFLGMFEAGMFPGCFYLLAMWYRRAEAQKRYSFFFSSTSLAGAFGGLIAYGCNHISGARGIEGWRWIFIIEGAVTMFCAVILYFLIVDFPEDAKFLKENEREFIKAKLALEVGESTHSKKVGFMDILTVFKDWKIWIAGLNYFAYIVPAYGYAYFATSIIKSLKYDAVETQLKSVYPWILSFGVSMLTASVADAIRNRFYIAMGCTFVSIAGFAMLLGVKTNFQARYAACFLVCAGTYSAMPLMVCWTTTNLVSHRKRMVGSAWTVGFGNIGGIIATFIFLSTEAPFYTKGNGICLAFMCLAAIVLVGYFLGVRTENQRKEAGRTSKWDQMSDEDRANNGDMNPAYRYAY